MSRLPLVAYLYNHANPVKLMLLPSHDINIQVKVVYKDQGDSPSTQRSSQPK